MSRYVRRKDGTFAGSLPTGHTPPPRPSMPVSRGPVEEDGGTGETVTDVHAAFQAMSGAAAGSRRPVTWSFSEPVWPKRSVVDAAVGQIPEATGENRALFARAFRSLYRDTWRKAFSEPDPDQPYAVRSRQPDSDAQGWAWRRQVIAETTELFAKAYPETGRRLEPGMAVYGQSGLRVVSGVSVFVDGEGREQETVVRFANGRMDRSAGDVTYVRLPRLDQASSGSPEVRGAPAAFAEHAERERLAEPGRDTDRCPYCWQYVPIVTHDCPSPTFPDKLRPVGDR